MGLNVRTATVLAVTALCLGLPRAAHADIPKPAGGGSDGAVACLGAADRDRLNPCDNEALRLSVTPTPQEALLGANGPCAWATKFSAVPSVCTFGAEREEATGEPFALLGDSHAEHFRAALAPVAVAKDRVGMSLTRSSCPYTALASRLRSELQAGCVAWTEAVPRWFARHPEVTTVIVSAHAGVRSVVPEGTDMFEAQVRGYQEAWRRLPATVSRIVVLRDVPMRNSRSIECIERAMAQGERAGFACALPRERALRPDAEVEAARRLDSRRVSVIDLSSFMCSPRLCFPVVGGVLVLKDVGHLTSAFSATLAPYLQRRLEQLLPTWR